MGDIELAKIAAQQEGLVTRPQARAHLSRKQLEFRLSTRRLIPVRWGVYRFAGAPSTPWQELRAACLAAGPAAVASHRSAAVLWDMPNVMCEEFEITAPWPQWPRLPGVRAHQSTRLPSEHCTVRHGVPVTTPSRTLADLSAVLPPQFLGWLVDGCLRRGLVTTTELHDVHGFLAGPGRRGLRGLAEVLERRPVGYQPGGSGAELDVLELLVDAGLPRPVQQHQVVIEGKVYLLDLAYPDLLIGIEYDGFAFHRLPTDLDRAAVRGNALELAGWTVLHFTAASARHRIVADVRAARERALRALAPSEV